MTFPVQVEATYWGAGLSAQTSAPLTERRTWMSTGSPRRSSSAAASARIVCRFWTVPWLDKPFPGASRCFSTRWFYGEWAALVTCTSTGPSWSRSLSAVLVSSSSNGNSLLVQPAAPPNDSFYALPWCQIKIRKLNNIIVVYILCCCFLMKEKKSFASLLNLFGNIHANCRTRIYFQSCVRITFR